jgi:hypothetical protein
MVIFNSYVKLPEGKFKCRGNHGKASATEAARRPQVGNACVGQSSCAVSVGDGTLNGQAETGEPWQLWPAMVGHSTIYRLISFDIKIMMLDDVCTTVYTRS